MKGNSVYDEIYAWVRRVPEGKVATYGQVAGLVGRCSARQVGYAMAALQDGAGVPWHRIINAQGRISLRTGSDGHRLQRILLEAEGIDFAADGSIDLTQYRWAEIVG
ncbi:MAG: cysteine methyltransferase [Gammaproteobacteria bacterium]|nr:cysteine methyltransferase [Gammaproteobacteria bacterium]